MTGAPAVSVIVVSRDRPALLYRCLVGLSQLWFDRFEIVVVSDPVGLAGIEAFKGRIKTVNFDEPNISKARNLGIEQAAGDVVAFIDDDAVPEPTWLSHLTAPFIDPEIVQTGGYVRGRNGISFQWRARVVNAMGEARDLAQEGDAPFQPKSTGDEAVKTEGTNMALRRSTIADMGGFDPGFHYFLDETDVNWRLKGAGTVLVPRAQVHHGFAASASRDDNRTATDLSEIGASTARFLKKYAADTIEEGRQKARHAQETRLRGQVSDARLPASDLDGLLAGFDAGFNAGLSRPIAPLAPLGPPKSPFLAFETQMTGETRFFAGRRWSSTRLFAKGRQAAKDGYVPHVLILTPSPRKHWLTFHPGGFWLQTGGIWGPTERTEPRFRIASFSQRALEEQARLDGLRKK